MKTFLSTRRSCALTLIEVLMVIAVLFIFAAWLLPRLARPRLRLRMRIQCVNNLRQAGLSFRVWEGDNGDKYPMQISQTNGGTMEFITGPNAFRHFQIMSNELNTPKVLFCPADSKILAANFPMFNNSNLSYFIGVDATETNADMMLLGDRNITNGTPIRNGLLELTTNHPAGWTAEMHVKAGNILMTDGSVQQVSVVSLRAGLANTGVATNRLQMP
jgi:type II secretory pathway pseudopilin PulG